MFRILILTLFFYYFSPSPLLAADSTYNVQSYGARPDGRSDCTKAFLTAWGAACAAAAPATIYVPKGKYVLGNIEFSGLSCKNTAITMKIDGTLVAPSNYNVMAKFDSWVKFHQVGGLSIIGGTLEGQGSALWACKTSGKSCPQGVSALSFINCSKLKVSGLTSIDSQEFHIVVHKCKDVKFSNIKISAPGDSPNTDGIHVEYSTGVTIMNSHIGTGDDCVSMGPGTQNMWIEGLECGPGHGVSIGSLAKEADEEGVQNITVKASTLKGTDNGLRVKTWARRSSGFVKDVVFEDIDMSNVKNPIVIDQHYCPAKKNCPGQESGVQISGVTYKGIRGTSGAEVGIQVDCSKAKPCTGIRMQGVQLTFQNKPVTASCSNAAVAISGASKLVGCASNNYYTDYTD